MSNTWKIIISLISILASLWLAAILVLRGIFTNFDNYGPEESAIGAYIYAALVLILGFLPAIVFMRQSSSKQK